MSIAFNGFIEPGGGYALYTRQCEVKNYFFSADIDNKRFDRCIIDRRYESFHNLPHYIFSLLNQKQGLVMSNKPRVPDLKL